MKTFIISSMLSILINTGNPVMFNNPPTNLIPTPYGTATKEYSYGTSTQTINTIVGDVSFPVLGYVSSMTYTFTKPSTGNFTLNTMNDLTNYYMFIEGGYLVSTTTNGFIFRVNHSTEFKCTVIVSDTAHPTWNYQQFVSITNQTIEQSDTVNEMIDDIVQYTYDIDGYTQTINGNTNTIKNILLQSMGGYISNDGSLYTDMQTLISVMNNINERMILVNNINWRDMSTMHGFTTDFSTYDTTNGSKSNGYILFNTYNMQALFYNHNPIIRMQIPINSITNSQYKVVAVSGSNTVTDISNDVIYTQFDRASATFYIKPSVNTNVWSNQAIGLQIGSSSKYVYFSTGSSLQYITDDDILYYQLLQTFENHYDNIKIINSIDGVKSAIENMSLNVNQLTVNATGITYNTTQQNVDNSVTNYQNNITTVNNIENNFKTMFDNANQNYNVDNIPITNEMISTGNFMKDVTTQLYGLDIIKYPTALLLLGIVIIALLG